MAARRRDIGTRPVAENLAGESGRDGVGCGVERLLRDPSPQQNGGGGCAGVRNSARVDALRVLCVYYFIFLEVSAPLHSVHQMMNHFVRR